MASTRFYFTATYRDTDQTADNEYEANTYQGSSSGNLWAYIAAVSTENAYIFTTPPDWLGGAKSWDNLAAADCQVSVDVNSVDHATNIVLADVVYCRFDSSLVLQASESHPSTGWDSTTGTGIKTFTPASTIDLGTATSGDRFGIIIRVQNTSATPDLGIGIRRGDLDSYMEVPDAIWAPPVTLDAIIFRPAVDGGYQYIYGLDATNFRHGEQQYYNTDSYDPAVIRVGDPGGSNWYSAYLAFPTGSIPSTGVIVHDVVLEVKVDSITGSSHQPWIVRGDNAWSNSSTFGAEGVGYSGTFDWDYMSIVESPGSLSTSGYESLTLDKKKALDYFKNGASGWTMWNLFPEGQALSIGSTSSYVSIDNTTNRPRIGVKWNPGYTIDAWISDDRSPQKFAVHVAKRNARRGSRYGSTFGTDLSITAAELAAAGFQTNDDVLVVMHMKGGYHGRANMRYGTSTLTLDDGNSQMITNDYAFGRSGQKHGFLGRLNLGGTLNDINLYASAYTSSVWYYIIEQELLVIRLADFGAEGIDWHFNRSTTDVAHTTSPDGTDRATVTWTPTKVEDWVWMAFTHIDVTSTTNDHLWTVDGADGFPAQRTEYSGTQNWYMRWGVLEQLPASSKTLTVHTYSDVSGNSHFESSLFVFRKDRFPDFLIDWETSGKSVTSAVTEIDNVAATFPYKQPVITATGGSLATGNAHVWVWLESDGEAMSPYREESRASNANYGRGQYAYAQASNTDEVYAIHTNHYIPWTDEVDISGYARIASGSMTLSGHYVMAWGLRLQPDAFTLDAVKELDNPYFYADAVVFGSGASSFAIDALKGQTTSDTLTLDAVVSKEQAVSFDTGAVVLAISSSAFTADAAVFASLSGVTTLEAVALSSATAAFSLDTWLEVTATGGATADAWISVVGICVWTTPADTVPISDTPTLAFLTPSASPGDMHFQIEIDTDPGFASPTVWTSYEDQTGWEYWDGDSWEPVPLSGMPVAHAGNEARYTVQSSLPADIYYRRVRAGAI